MNCRPPLLAWLAVLLTLPWPVSAAEPLGRLFLTPERREILDRQRALNTLESQAAAPEPTIEINGQVRRSSGKRTTWINGQAQHDTETRSGIVAHPDARGAAGVVIESSEEPRTSLKVGESVNRSTQEAVSPLGEGTITIHRPASRNDR